MLIRNPISKTICSSVWIIFPKLLRPIPWTFQNATVESNAAQGAAASVRTNSKVMANFLKNNRKNCWKSGWNLQKLNVGGVYIQEIEKPSGSKQCLWHIFFREVSAFSSLVRDSGCRSRYIEMRIVWCSISPCRFSSWWLNQPIWKIWWSKWDSSPQRRGENSKKSLKPLSIYIKICHFLGKKNNIITCSEVMWSHRAAWPKNGTAMMAEMMGTKFLRSWWRMWPFLRQCYRIGKI